VKESGAVLLQPLNSVIVEPLFTTREALDKYQLVEKAKKLETLVSEEELNIQKLRKLFLIEGAWPGEEEEGQREEWGLKG